MEYGGVNVHDSILLPGSLKKLKQLSKALDLPLKGSILNLDMGFDSKVNRKRVWNHGLIPNIPENPRNRNTSKPKRGRPRTFKHLSYKRRFSVERTFAWEDAYRGLVLRYDCKQSHFLAHKLLCYTLINLRWFCGGKSQ